MVLSQQQLTYWYFIEISLTFLQNYKITAFRESAINSFEVPKSETKTSTTTK